MYWPPGADGFARLRDTLGWVAERSPWYRRLLDAAGVRVADLGTYDDFRRRVPRTEKTDLAENQRAHPPFGEFLAVPRDDIASLHTSPGPIYIPRLAAERGGTAVLVEAIRAMGVRPREVAHVTLSYHVMPGGLRLHRAFEEYGCLVINGGTGASRLQVQIAHDYGATVYAGTPSFLANLIDTAREMGLRLPYRLGFSTAEALTPALRASLGIELFDHIGEAQIGPVAGECRAHDGLHLHARDLFCEFLDPETGEPAAPGGVGELVATQLGPRALPLVRYAPRDAYRLLAGACPCGDPGLRVTFVGQVGVIRKIKGVLVHPAQIHAVTSQFPELGRFQVTVDHPEGQRYERALLRVGTVTAPADPELLRRALAERLKATVLVQMEVELVPEADIPEAAGPPRFAEAMVKR
jgi:phenylacetate-coenzyme A ligase PaaK-like adenylate-forming protein